jgi:hypothetical protein
MREAVVWFAVRAGVEREEAEQNGLHGANISLQMYPDRQTNCGVIRSIRADRFY